MYKRFIGSMACTLQQSVEVMGCLQLDQLLYGFNLLLTWEKRQKKFLL